MDVERKTLLKFREIFARPAAFSQCRTMLGSMPALGDCRPLQSREEVDAATRIIESLRLPSHHDHQKNWDNLKCLYYIVQNVDRCSPILDAGSGADSKILTLLSRLGYERLYACDIRSSRRNRYGRRGIDFSVQDITRTTYADSFFKAITSISVIEHGIILEHFVAEMHRILDLGGLLLITTDYWSEPVDCHGIYPYGREAGEMKVFQPSDLEHLHEIALQYGFALCRPLNLQTNARVVRWQRVNREYTFAFMALRKER